MAHPLCSEDEGKRVVTTDGVVVGSVARVAPGCVHVEPRSGLLAGYGSWLHSPWCSATPFRLDGRAVARVTDETVVVFASDEENVAPATAAKK